MATNEQRRARALQQRTLWRYCECLNLIRTKTPDEIEAVIRARNEAKPKPEV